MYALYMNINAIAIVIIYKYEKQFMSINVYKRPFIAFVLPMIYVYMLYSPDYMQNICI